MMESDSIATPGAPPPNHAAAAPAVIANMPLTCRERINRMMQRKDHDRIPRCDNYWPDTLDRWRGEGLVGDPLDHLGSDIEGVCWSWPKPFPGREEVVSEDHDTKTVINAMGNTLRHSKVRSSTPEHVAFGCADREQWHAEYRPALLAAPSGIDLDAVRARVKPGKDRGLWLTLKGIEPITGVHQLVGDEVALIAEAAEPDWVADMAEVFTDLILRDFQIIVDADLPIDGMWLYGDLAYNHGPFFSPTMYRELFAPQHQRMVDWAHGHDLRVIYHTDGDFRLLMDDMLATGIDCLQPLEAKAGLDLRELVPAHGDRVSFMGNIDMIVASTNDLDRVEAEVIAKINAGKAHRGYCYHSDHSVPTDVSWTTYRRIIALLNEHGGY